MPTIVYRYRAMLEQQFGPVVHHPDLHSYCIITTKEVILLMLLKIVRNWGDGKETSRNRDKED